MVYVPTSVRKDLSDSFEGKKENGIATSSLLTGHGYSVICRL